MDTLSSALSLTKFIYDTISAVEDGPKNVKATAEKVLQFRGQLERVRQLCDRDDPSHAALLNDVQQSVAEISAFAAKLQKLQVNPNERATGKMWKTLKTAFSEKDLETISTGISQRTTHIGTHLDILARTTSMELKAEAAVTSTILQRIEQSTVDHIDMASLHHGEVISQFSTIEALIKQTMAQVQKSVESVGAISISRAEAMHQTLAEIRQEQQQGHRPSPYEQLSAILGEVRDDCSLHTERASAKLRNNAHNKIDQSAAESIERLGNLIHEKERTFNTFDSDDDEICESILEDLSNILTAGKYLARGLAETSPSLPERDGHLAAARALNRFNKTHGSRSLTINSEDQAVYRRPRESPSPLKTIRTEHRISLPVGFLTLNQRKIIRSYICENRSCADCRGDTTIGTVHQKQSAPTELVTTVSIMVNRARNPVMIVAKDWSATSTTFPAFTTSVSYLALNPVLPHTSKVFDVVSEGDSQQLRQMLQNGEASLRDTDENGRSLLFYSPFQPSMTRFLLDSGLDINHVSRVEDDMQQTALLRFYNMYLCQFIMPNAVHTSLELLLEAGADPLIDSYEHSGIGESLLALHANCGSEGEAANYARIAIRNGTISAADVAGPLQKDEWTLMHHACADLGHGSKRNIAAILDLGIDINAETRKGWTCLSMFSWKLCEYLDAFYPLLAVDTITKDRDTLVFLLQAGADPYWRAIATERPLTVFQEAFQCNCLDSDFSKAGNHQPLGGYRGDVWDSALFLCGYNMQEFRTGYQRRPNYTSWYEREAFEALWKGREKDCPYWDDSPWPKFGDERDGAPLCSECMDKPDKRPPYMQPWVIQENDLDSKDEDWEDCSDDDDSEEED